MSIEKRKRMALIIKISFTIHVNFDKIYNEFTDAETQEVDFSDDSWDYQRSLETVVLIQHDTNKLG